MSTSLDFPQAGIQPPKFRLPAATRVGRVRLAVSNLQQSVEFYSTVIGLTVLPSGSKQLARLGVAATGTVLLELEEIPGVRSLGRSKRLGLYHTAFLLPARTALSSFVQHLKTRNVPFAASDHLVSEALYLTDPDGLTVEVYADRPREEWIVDGRELVMGVAPLRFQDLPKTVPGSWNGVPAGTTVGHVHFYVGGLEKAKSFYHDALGLDIMLASLPGALFVSAGGYHHHVGLNVWAAGSPPASDRDARLLFWELILPCDADVAAAMASLEQAGYSATADGPAFSDPWGIRLALRSY